MKFQEIDISKRAQPRGGKYAELFACVVQLPPGKAIKIDAADLGGSTIISVRSYLRTLARQRSIHIFTRLAEDGGLIIWRLSQVGAANNGDAA